MKKWPAAFSAQTQDEKFRFHTQKGPTKHGDWKNGIAHQFEWRLTTRVSLQKRWKVKAGWRPPFKFFQPAATLKEAQLPLPCWRITIISSSLGQPWNRPLAAGRPFVTHGSHLSLSSKLLTTDDFFRTFDVYRNDKEIQFFFAGKEESCLKSLSLSLYDKKRMKTPLPHLHAISINLHGNTVLQWTFAYSQAKLRLLECLFELWRTWSPALSLSEQPCKRWKKSSLAVQPRVH